MFQKLSVFLLHAKIKTNDPFDTSFPFPSCIDAKLISNCWKNSFCLHHQYAALCTKLLYNICFWLGRTVRKAAQWTYTQTHMHTVRTKASLSEEILIYPLLSRLLLEATFTGMQRENTHRRHTTVYQSKTAGCTHSTKCQNILQLNLQFLLLSTQRQGEEEKKRKLIWAN